MLFTVANDRPSDVCPTNSGVRQNEMPSPIGGISSPFQLLRVLSRLSSLWLLPFPMSVPPEPPPDPFPVPGDPGALFAEPPRRFSRSICSAIIVAWRIASNVVIVGSRNSTTGSVGSGTTPRRAGVFATEVFFEAQAVFASTRRTGASAADSVFSALRSRSALSAESDAA